MSDLVDDPRKGDVVWYCEHLDQKKVEDGTGDIGWWTAGDVQVLEENGPEPKWLALCSCCEDDFGKENGAAVLPNVAVLREDFSLERPN